MDEETQVEETVVEEEEEIVEEPVEEDVLRDPNYVYKWGNTVYQRQQELKVAQPDACEPGEHDWRTTFAFGVHDCFLCDTRREVR